jgi:pimeloyl-ACP methyl ester carboxylesterase
MRRVATNGLALVAREWPGPEPAIVGVHGLTANHTCWESLADAIAGRHRVIAYDLRGRGDSDKPGTGYSLAHHADDLAGLLDAFGLARAILMGHSLGAAIALRFAVSRPERVSRLILIDGGFDLRAEILDSIRPAVERLGIEFPSLELYLTMLQGLPMFAGRWNTYLTRYFTYDVEPGPGGGVRSKVARHAIEEELTNLARERLWIWHHTVQAPTLLLRAPRELATDTDCVMTQDEAEAAARAIPRSTLAVIPGSNHYTILLGTDAHLQAALWNFLG